MNNHTTRSVARRRPLAPLCHLPRAALSALPEPLSIPEPDGSAKTYPEKLHSIVEQISQLTLLETAQLNELLKVSSCTLSGPPGLSSSALPASLITGNLPRHASCANIFLAFSFLSYSGGQRSYYINHFEGRQPVCEAIVMFSVCVTSNLCLFKKEMNTVIYCNISGNASTRH